MIILSTKYLTKYLRVIINHNLSWANYIGAVTHKPNGVYAFLQRNLRKCLVLIKSLAYYMYVRPILEYTYNTGLPISCIIIILDMIVAITDMFIILNWTSLQQRRNQAKCVVS